MHQYILFRNNTFYYRRRIPKAFLSYFTHCKEIRLHLLKKSMMGAILETKRINTLFEELILALQLDTFDQKEKLVEDYMKIMRDGIKECYYSGINTNMITKTAIQFEQLQCEQSIQSNYSHIASSQINDVFVDADVDPTKIDRSTYKQIEKLYLHKKIEMLQEIIHIIDPKKDFASSSIPTTSVAVIKPTNITFKELYALFLKEKRQMYPDTSTTTWRDYEAAYKDFIFVIDDAENRDISTFQKEDFRTFIEALHHHIPSSRTKKPQYRDLPYSALKDIILEDSSKMAIETKKKKMASIKQMFDIAIDQRYAYLSVNNAQPFVIKVPKKKKSAPKPRDELSIEILQKLFASKPLTDSKIRMLEPEKFWIPTLAIYTGMRQNEICQLKIEDVKQELVKYEDREELVWYFDINEKDDKHLKNENATRFLPLHPKLIELGFIDYFNSIKDNHDQLWPNLRLHPIEKRYNIDYSKAFMKFFRAHITTNVKQTFHSLRHNFGAFLEISEGRNLLLPALKNQLMGHEPEKNMTSSVYGKGYAIRELYEGIKTLEVPLF